jgi:hypothetical protein
MGQAHMEIKATGVFLGTKYAIPAMRKAVGDLSSALFGFATLSIHSGSQVSVVFGGVLKALIGLRKLAQSSGSGIIEDP